MMSPGVHVSHNDDPRVHVWQYDERKKPEPNNTVTVVVNDVLVMMMQLHNCNDDAAKQQ